MRVQALGLLVSSLLFACADEQQGRCDDVTARLDEALQADIDKGILLPDSVACELTQESFDPRVSAASMEYLLNAFSRACDEQALCSGISTEAGPPPSTRLPANGPGPATAQ